MKTPTLLLPALCSLTVSTVVLIVELPDILHAFDLLFTGERSLPDAL